MKGRLIPLGFFDAYTNMALDEAIFIRKQGANSAPTLRFYSFRPPALSLGYFQRIGEEDFRKRCLPHPCPSGRRGQAGVSGGGKEPSRRSFDIVRRITGGKAVLHEGELSYSFTASRPHLSLPLLSSEFYQVVSRSIVKGLKFLGIEAMLNLQSSRKVWSSLPAERAFCLSSLSEYDVILADSSAQRQGRKLVGSAQRKRKGIILQQGSIFINNVNLPDLAESIVRGFAEELRIEFEPAELDKEEIKLARELRKNKYSSREWNYKR